MESEEQVERKAGLEIGPQLATPRELVDDPSHPFSSAGDEALPCEVDRGLAWVRDLFERIDVDSRDEKAVAVWKAAADERISRSDSVYEWLRRDGANLHLAVYPLRSWVRDD